jgi:hypothetical protein
MNTFAKSALVLGTVGALALGSMTASDARSGRRAAVAVGVAAGVTIGAAAANAAYYNSGYYDSGYYDAYAYSPGYSAYAYEPAYTYAAPVQYRDPAFAYTGDPAYRGGYGAYGYAPGYDAYAYAPGYRAYRSGSRRLETQSAPRHYDPGAGYNSNTLAPWQDWKYQGNDY